MHCYICDINMERVVTDPLTGKIKHCSTCDEIIQDNLSSLERRGQKEEENSGELPMLDQDFDDEAFLFLDLDEVEYED